MYLLRSHIVDIATHTELCTLTASYLSLPGAGSDLDTEDIKFFLVTGYYAFLEYAIAC